MQKRLNFKPHVVPLLVGSKVQFKNDDKVKYNLFSEDKCCPVDKDMAGGGTETLAFDEPGLAHLLCRLHPEMSLHVLVLETPLFATAQFQRKKVDGKRVYEGEYSMTDIPPGNYVLKTWNKKLQPIERAVTITAGKTTKVDLALGGDVATPAK